MIDQFHKDFVRCEKNLKTIQSDLVAREERVQQQQSTVKTDSAIGASIKTLNGDVASLSALVEQYEKDPSLYNITSREAERRRKQVQDLKNASNEVSDKFSKTVYNSAQNTRYKGSQPEKKFVEAFDVENMSNQQLMQTEKDMISEQDKHIDGLAITVGAVKTGQLHINQELKYQNEDLLPKLDRGVDKNIKQTKRADGRLIELLRTADNCRLYIIIAIEILVLVFLLMAF